MKIKPRCISCLIRRAIIEGELATEDENLHFEILKRFTAFLSNNISRDKVPAHLGTMRDRIIKEVTKNPDPYKELKEITNKIALEISKNIKYRNLNELISLSASANAIEFGVLGHEFALESIENSLRKDIPVPDLIIDKIENSQKILFLTDNAGEFIFDLLLIEELKKRDKEVFIAAKEVPVINDVTIEEVKEFTDAPVLSAGKSVGVNFEEADKDFLKLFGEADLIISKGMGNYEVLSECEGKLSGRLLYVLKAKCLSVAESLGVEHKKIIIKLV
ncbi:MAG: DUF89 domain-containing protein [Candidatus Hydrothermarchaeota archaeon]